MHLYIYIYIHSQNNTNDTLIKNGLFIKLLSRDQCWSRYKTTTTTTSTITYGPTIIGWCIEMKKKFVFKNFSRIKFVENWWQFDSFVFFFANSVRSGKQFTVLANNVAEFFNTVLYNCSNRNKDFKFQIFQIK